MRFFDYLASISCLGCLFSYGICCIGFWLLMMSCPKGFCMVSWCICGQAAETFRHLFIDWPHVRLVWDHFQRIVSVRDVAFLTLMLCFFIGGSVPFLVVIFKSSCLTSFCGKFGRPVMLLGLIPSLSLLMQLSIKWCQILGLLVSFFTLSFLN